MTTNRQALSVEEMREKVLEKFPDAFSFQWTGFWRIYRKEHGVMGPEIGGPASTEDGAWIDAYTRHCTAPEPSDAEIREQAEVIEADLLVLSPSANQRSRDRIVELLRTEAAYKRGKGE